MPGRAKVLTPKEINDIFSLLKTSRNQALFAVGIYTGMRIGEVIRLRYEQVYTTSGGVRNLLKVSLPTEQTGFFGRLRNWLSMVCQSSLTTAELSVALQTLVPAMMKHRSLQSIWLRESTKEGNNAASKHKHHSKTPNTPVVSMTVR
jgi:hypothetical protein